VDGSDRWRDGFVARVHVSRTDAMRAATGAYICQHRERFGSVPIAQEQIGQESVESNVRRGRLRIHVHFNVKASDQIDADSEAKARADEVA
jgi:hypothetical protein